MKKNVFAITAIASLLFVSCAKKTDEKPVETETEDSQQEESYTFTNEYAGFTLELPYKFIVLAGESQQAEITPKEDNSYYAFISSEDHPGVGIESFAVVKTLTYDEVLTTEESRVATLCEQTDACEKIVSKESIVIGNMEFLKLTTEWSAGTIDKPEGTTTKEISYIFSKDSKLNIVSTIEMEGINNAEAELDAIMQTIKF